MLTPSSLGAQRTERCSGPRVGTTQERDHPEVRKRVHFFNSFFYKKLTQV